jgi:hypothetical protein
MSEHVRLFIAWIHLIVARGAFDDEQNNECPMRFLVERELIEQICTRAFAEPNKYILKLIRNRNPLYNKRYNNYANEDREFVLAAVNLCGTALKFASPYLRSDREIVLTAVRNDGIAIKYANKMFREDKEIVEAAVKQNCKAIRFKSAVKQNCKAIKWS